MNTFNGSPHSKQMKYTNKTSNLKPYQFSSDSLIHILENMSDGFFAFDAQWRFVYINKLAEELFASPKEELLYKVVWEVIPHVRSTSFFKNYQKAVRTKKPVHFEYYYERSKRWYFVHAYPTNDGLTVYFRDITEKKLIQEQMQFNATITESIADAVITTDMTYTIHSWNNGAEKMYGWKSSEVIGLDASNIFRSEFIDKKNENVWKKALKNKGYWKGEVQQHTKNGDIISVLASVSTINDAKGQGVGLVAVNRDITAQKQFEQLLTFKAEASRVLVSSLNYRKTLKSMANLAVKNIADWCSIELLHASGNLEQLAVAHKNTKKVSWAKQYRKKYPPNLSSNNGIANVLRTGKSEFYPQIDMALLQQTITDKEQFEQLKNIGFRAAMIVPLTVRGRTIGVISFISSESNRHYTKIDLEMAEQLASRASLAIENATLYEEVSRERERLHTLLANVPAVVWEAWGKPDEQLQRIDFVSKYVEKMLGYSVNEWLATPNFWLTIVHPDDKKRAADEAAAIFATNKGGVSRFRWQKKNGKSLWVEAQSYVIHDSKGVPIGMRGVTLDISDRMELEKRKDEFISMASHELKTPVTSMNLFVEILQKHLADSEDYKTQEFLQRIHKQTNKLKSLISNLLDISRIQTGKLHLQKETFAIDSLIDETIEAIQTATKRHTIEFSKRSSSEVYADRFRLYQVLANLLTNAIKYSPKGGKITITAEKNTDMLTIAVKDLGIGISADQQEKIFSKLYQVDSDSGKTYPGLGMGLYISAGIVKSHQGAITVESKKGKGSTFIITLPIIKAKRNSRR
jgi:PAS domain S-box-containing protein